ncbi:dsDNA nuclease domain-containing protein [Burkholderia ubonensis]|uniref:dsDNA nuclease domain-containing protein n=1 Tax=Burkholderia ubonensis TaxID=101571 RepID=UPI0012FA111A|nr:dsDNA nuclease domain-containing protein [Burkholderia ubonensis]
MTVSIKNIVAPVSSEFLDVLSCYIYPPSSRRKNNMENVPLGEPGLGSNGAPARAHDQTPRTRRAFSYQDYVAYTLLMRSIDGSPHTEVWVEHHEDILAIRKDGRYDLYQVKTRESSDEPWLVSDKAILESIKKFCLIELSHGESVEKYYIYSNLRPYIPSPEAGEERRARSLHVLQHEIGLKEKEQWSIECAERIRKLIGELGVKEGVLLNVLKKIGFVVGPPLTLFQDDPTTVLCSARPGLVKWPVRNALDLQDELLRLVEAAGSARVPALFLHTSPVSAGGLPSAEISWRRIETETMRRKVSARMRQRKVGRVAAFIAGIIVCMAIGGIVFRPIFQVSALQHALNVVQNSGDGVLPAEFNESVAIIRASGKPLRHLDLDGANIECRDLSSLDMLRTTGQGMHATGVIFDNSLLGGGIFSNSELNGSKFRHARMDNSYFIKSNMLVSNLFAVEARNANFSEANLDGATLSHGAFSGANFVGTNLSSAEINGADFSKVNLKNAVLKDANVSGADFTGATNLTQEMLASACVIDGKVPVVDSPLKPTTKPCYTTHEGKKEREIKRFAMLFVGQMAVSEGYCRNSQLKFRAADSKLHPEGNETIWYGADELTDVPAR